MDTLDQDPREENKMLRDELETYKAKLSTANEEKERLSQDLEVFKTRLLELMPDNQQLSESSVLDAYKRIYANINNWIDYVSIDENGFFIETYKATLGNKQRFQEAGMDSYPTFLVYLGECDTCAHVVLSLLISEFLCNEVFKKEYPIGFPFAPHLDFINVVRDRMANASTEETFHFDRWRSEMFTALTAAGTFDEKKVERTLDTMFQGLLKNLEYWLGKETLSEKHRRRLRDQVFEPAVKLHNMLQCSIQRYTIDVVQKEEIRPPIIPEGSWRFKNLLTWKPVERDDVDYAFACLSPRLYLKEEQGQIRELAQPVLLAYEAGRRRRSSISEESISESPVSSPSSSPSSLVRRHSYFPISETPQRTQIEVGSHRHHRHNTHSVASKQPDPQAPGRSKTWSSSSHKTHNSHKR